MQLKTLPLLLLFILCAQFTLGVQKVITTQVNLSINSTGLLLNAEENTKEFYYVNSSTNYTTNITLIFYRDIIVNSSLENLSVSYGILSDNYDSLRRSCSSTEISCKTLNSSYNNLVDYYANMNSAIGKINNSNECNREWANCFFSLDFTNKTLNQCQADLTSRTNELNTCSSEKTNAQNSYSTCTSRLGNYQGSGVCATDLQNASGSQYAWVWSAIITGALVWFICYMVYRRGTKYQPHSEVTGDTEHFEGLG